MENQPMNRGQLGQALKTRTLLCAALGLLLTIACGGGPPREAQDPYLPFIPPEDRAKMVCTMCGTVGLEAKIFYNTNEALRLRCRECNYTWKMRPMTWEPADEGD